MVSVCIATYNGERFICQQLESILFQLSAEDEVIVSDDGSSDSTLAIVASFEDPRIQVLHHQKTKKYTHAADYAARNFEYALMHAKGEIIILSDQDDVWLPGRVEIMQEYLRHNTLVVSDCRVVDADLNIIHPSHFAVHRTKKGVLNNLYINTFVGSSMAFRRELLDIAFPFPDHAVCHDFWLGLLASCKGKVEFIDQPLTLYRRHEHTATPLGRENTLSLIYKISYRIQAAWALLWRLLRS